MADVTKIKLPDNSTVNIKDYRIPGVDTVPTSGSNNLITSGGVYQELEDGDWVTTEEYTQIEGVLKDTYTKEEVDEIIDALPASNITTYDIQNWNDKVSNIQADWTATTGDAVILHKPTLATVATSGSYNDLTNKPTIPTESTVAGWGFIKQTSGGVNSVKVGSTTYNPTNGVVSLPAYPTTLPASDVSAWAKASTKPTYTASEVGAATESYVDTAVAGIVNSAPTTLDTLNELATALGNDPNFATTVATQIGQKYTKPSGGIPATDLASAVQTSLGKADTALQSYTETDPTVPSWAKASSKPTYTAAEVGALPDTTVIPSAPGTLKTNATTAQTASSGEVMSGTITLHKIAKTGTYSDLIGTPTIPSAPGTLKTNNTTAQSTSASESFSGTINLHQVAKTGSYNDLLNKPTIPAAVTESTVAGWGFTKNTGTLTSETDPVFSASAAAGITSSDITNWNGKTSNTGTLTGVTFNNTAATVTNGVAAITATIPSAPGTLNTNNTTAQSASSSESFSGTIKLHKVAKTGTYSDLIGKPTIPTKVSDLTNDSGFTSNTGTITGITMNGSSKGTSGVVNLGTVLTAHQDISGKASLSGAAFTGAVTGTSSGNTGQFRNITISSSEPTSSQGSNGDIWIVV